jgi:hypothetical protein
MYSGESSSGPDRHDSRSRWSRPWISGLLLQAASLTGCHLGGAQIIGVVTDASGSQNDHSRLLAPSSEVKVSVECPADHRRDGHGMTAKTDRYGYFSIVMETRFSTACSLVVEKPGFEPLSIPLQRACPPDPEAPGYCPLEIPIAIELRSLSKADTHGQ